MEQKEAQLAVHKFDKVIGLAKVMIISVAAVLSLYCLSKTN